MYSGSDGTIFLLMGGCTGWYGHDCSRKVAGKTIEEGRIPKQHWLQVTGVLVLSAYGYRYLGDDL
jgi:hypothetical protein